MENNKDLKNEEIKEENLNEEVNEDTELKDEEVMENTAENTNEVEEEDELNMTKKLKEENKKMQEELDLTKDRLLRLTAEYDNYRKRTTKEKESIYADAYIDVIKEILPVIDNLERAMAAEGNVDDLKKGVEMTVRQFEDALEKLQVEEISTENGFDPELHQAMMVVEQEGAEPNQVAQVFQKGYKRGDKVIRHSMVTVTK